jgi:putative flippase GtrA
MRVARYTAVSVFSIVLTQLLLQVLARSSLGATRANAFAVLLAAVPAFALNRSWTWNDRKDETSIRRQAAVFWVTVLVGLVASTLVVSFVSRSTSGAFAVGVASLATFAALWLLRFLVLDRIAFDESAVVDATWSWLVARRTGLAVLGPLLLLVGLVNAWGVDEYPARFDDEGTYVSQAWALMSEGHLAHYTYWYDHPPAGWIQLVPWLWLGEGLDRAPSAIGAGREMMVAVVLVSAALLYLWARRIGIHRVFAVAAVLLFSLSPLALYWHRQVLLDNIAVMWLLAALALAVSPRGRLAAHAGAGACFAIAVLTKETALLLLPAVAYQLWRAADPRTRRYSMAVAGSLFAAIVAFYPLFALLRGELLPGDGHVSLWQGVVFQLVSREGSGSVFSPASDAHQIVMSWLRLDPWVLGSGAALAPVALLVPRLRPAALALLVSIAVIARPGYLPVPYLISLLPFAAIVTAGIADALLRLAASRRGRTTTRRLAWSASVRVPAAAVLAIMLAIAFGRVAPAWATDLERDLDASPDTLSRHAERWIEHHVSRDSPLLVDDTMWLDLVRDGFPQKNVVWYYKLDQDPGVGASFPHGWRDFDYVVSTQILRTTNYDIPSVKAALAHSRLVARFGAGQKRIDIRRIEEVRHGAHRDRPHP